MVLGSKVTIPVNIITRHRLGKNQFLMSTSSKIIHCIMSNAQYTIYNNLNGIKSPESHQMLIDLIWFIVFSVTFSNISAISCRPVYVVEEAGVSGENHRLWARNWQSLLFAVGSRVHPFCNLQSRAWTDTVLVIGLYELLGNPTT